MSERDRLSRELGDKELPDEDDQEIEEARTVHRKAPPLAGRAGGSEERAGIEKRPRKPPVLEERPPLKPPPIKPGK
jgi:hypothetical protein